MFRRLSLAAIFAASFGSPASAASTPHVDEFALRYYASLGQKDRVAAEARRLSRLDPAWHMPDDIDTAQPSRGDESPLWQLYRENRLDDLASAIAQRQAVEPDWKPSEDLQAKIKAKQVRTKIMTLAKTGEWDGIVHAFRETGIAWAKDDAEALWVIAEAHAREDDCDEAFNIYQSILANHTDPNERRATIEFAIPLIPMAMTDKLIAMARVDATGTNEFDSIAIDIARARISAYLHHEPAKEISDDELTRFKAFAHDSANSNEPGLVAWYDFQRHDYKDALDWFKLAISHGGDAMVAHGLAHTLRELDRRREAEEVAYAWREPLVNNTILFIDLLEEDFTQERPPFIEADRVARYARVTMETESGEGAQALAWYAYNTCQYPLALQWFERAMAWLPKEATAYGYALTLERLHRAKHFRDMVNRYDGLFPSVVALAFNDGIRKPRTACEKRPGVLAEANDSAAIDPDGANWTGRTMADTWRPQVASTEHLGRDRPAVARFSVPSPNAASDGSGLTLPPLRKKTEFPVSVTPENPLRFSALLTIATSDVSDRVRGTWPLVARRVPGVGPMPYERYGFALRPAWDGTKEASSPTAMEQKVPEGTLWALAKSLQEAAHHQSPSGSSDALSRLPMAKTSHEFQNAK
jgi:cellulose synthase operon protein C